MLAYPLLPSQLVKKLGFDNPRLCLNSAPDFSTCTMRFRESTSTIGMGLYQMHGFQHTSEGAAASELTDNVRNHKSRGTEKLFYVLGVSAALNSVCIVIHQCPDMWLSPENNA